MKRRSWTVEQLKGAVETSTSYRQTLFKLHLKETGGNYKQLHKYIAEYKLDNTHFKGPGWKKGTHLPFKPETPLNELLVEDTIFQSHKLKLRLFKVGLKERRCEECGWAKISVDGRIPLELDHINGNPLDNRLENLRILCPNCHSLKPTHRGANRKLARMVEWHTLRS